MYTEVDERINPVITALPFNISKTENLEEVNLKQHIDIVIVRGKHETGFSSFSLPYERQKYYWGTKGIFNPSQQTRGSFIVYEAPEEQLEQSRDSLTFSSLCSELLQPGEPMPKPWRGIFSPTHKRKILFTKKMTFNISELPRRKPHVEIDRRTLERIDD